MEISHTVQKRLSSYLDNDTLDVLFPSLDGANGPEAQHLATELVKILDLLFASADGANNSEAQHLARLFLHNFHT